MWCFDAATRKMLKLLRLKSSKKVTTMKLSGVVNIIAFNVAVIATITDVINVDIYL